MIDVESLLDDMGVEEYETGERFTVCSPFHNNTHPSCEVWKDSGYFKCFAVFSQMDLHTRPSRCFLLKNKIEVQLRSNLEECRNERNCRSLFAVHALLCK